MEISKERKEARLRAVDNKLIKEVNTFKRSLYEEHKEDKWFTWKMMKEEIFNHFLDLGYPGQDIQAAYDIIASINKRRERVFNKVRTIFANLNQTMYFGTLTFTDEVLKNTSYETRRVYVARYLKSLSSSYIANIDYGDKEKNPNSNEREHYHCLICCDAVPDAWVYGFCKFEVVPCKTLDELKVSKYIVKLSFHGLKQTKDATSPRLIYSKSKLLLPTVV